MDLHIVIIDTPALPSRYRTLYVIKATIRLTLRYVPFHVQLIVFEIKDVISLLFTYCGTAP